MLKKIASNYLDKKAAQNFGIFDPRVWHQRFSTKRARAQQKYYQSPTKADVITRPDGTTEKNYDREQARMNYYADKRKAYRVKNSKGGFDMVYSTGTPTRQSSDPAQFERDNNRRFQESMNRRQQNYQDISKAQMSQGPDMTKNLPRTGVQRKAVELKADLDKITDRIGQIPLKAFNNATTAILKTSELNPALWVARGISNIGQNPKEGQSRFFETGERTQIWDWLRGKANSPFKQVQAPKSGIVGNTVAKGLHYASYASPQNIAMYTDPTFVLGAWNRHLQNPQQYGTAGTPHANPGQTINYTQPINQPSPQSPEVPPIPQTSRTSSPINQPAQTAGYQQFENRVQNTFNDFQTNPLRRNNPYYVN